MNITIEQLKQAITAQSNENLFADLYGYSDRDYSSLERIHTLVSKFSSDSIMLFSAPGRTELGGNHTDHNNGKVLCGAVRQDALAAVTTTDDTSVVITSDGFDGRFEVDLADLESRPSEFGTTTALVRGVIAGFNRHGANTGGFCAHINSVVAIGSGLSSSASFEVLIGTIINHLYNDDRVSGEEISRVGQFAENRYFNKPCGLMDQTASALGGVLQIDFRDLKSIGIKKLNFDLTKIGYQLMVVDVGSDHTDLTDAYAAIPKEMKAIAQDLGGEVLREVNAADLMAQIPALRRVHGDRAIQRALHFFAENRRVDQMTVALEENDIDLYLSRVQESGLSSSNLLQNVIPPDLTGREQGLALALGASDVFFNKRNQGVARVHGGGFAGTIQAYVHQDDSDDYIQMMDQIFGTGATEKIYIRNTGACHILNI